MEPTESMHEEHFRRLEHMYLDAPINEYFAPAIRVGQGWAEVSMRVRQDFFHAANAVHGAAYFKLLDDSAFFAASSLVEDVFILTVAYNLYFLRPISEGLMQATGQVVHESQRLIVAESVIIDSNQREIARGSGTFMRSKIRLTEEIGYK